MQNGKINDLIKRMSGTISRFISEMLFIYIYIYIYIYICMCVCVCVCVWLVRLFTSLIPFGSNSPRVTKICLWSSFWPSFPPPRSIASCRFKYFPMQRLSWFRMAVCRLCKPAYRRNVPLAPSCIVIKCFRSDLFHGTTQ
jgi:hypothetical protein